MSSDPLNASLTLRHCFSLTGLIATRAGGPRVGQTVADALENGVCSSAKITTDEGDMAATSSVLKVALADDSTAVDISSLSKE